MMLLKLTSGSSYSSLINESLVGGPIYRKTMLYIYISLELHITTMNNTKAFIKFKLTIIFLVLGSNNGSM